LEQNNELVAPPRGARAGFTLVEVLVAIAILSVAFASAAFMLTSAFGAYKHQDRTLEANRLAQNTVEALSATPYAALAQAIANGTGGTLPLILPPGMNFTRPSAGEATAHYQLTPPTGPQDDWHSHAMPVFQPGQPPLTTTGTQPHLDATLTLQYWDASLDAPALQNSGLIRACYVLNGLGVSARHTKYLAR
jgi:prepilin-type N-terminal cleavage/methylation domain-containing protein